METYIIRVYRNNGARLAGLLEAVEEGSQHAFRDFDVLVCLLEQATGHGECADGNRHAYANGCQVEGPRRAAR